MRTIDLEIGETFLIEQCTTCYGIFFDPNELETLIDLSVTNVFDIDMAQIGEHDEELPVKKDTVAYIKCPVCRKFMNRTNFGNRSGVIADKCSTHGVWLDSGELRRLFEWSKAGGQLLDRQKQEENEADSRSMNRSRKNLQKLLDSLRARSTGGMY
jgi:Zn-finger nucleic acid-binding protein